MRLASFLEASRKQIMEESRCLRQDDSCAGEDRRTGAAHHLPQVLEAISSDLRTAQSRTQSIAKSHGHAPAASSQTSAQTHGLMRAQSGIDIEQLVAEFRAMRSSVLRLWAEAYPAGPHTIEDIMRFNEAIDQAVAESVQFYARERDRWREIFLGVLGHDLRAPLNAIALTASLMAQQGVAPAKQTALLGRGAARMKALLDALLEYSRSNLGVGMALHLAPTDLASDCAEELELQRAAHPYAQIEFSAQGHNDGVFDASRVREALGNLVSNAVKHGEPGEPVTVEIEGGAASVRVSVQNVGDLAPEGIEELFEPLRSGRTHVGADRTHLGLGLFITRQIARAHGGEVTGKCSGSRVRFTVELPKR